MKPVLTLTFIGFCSALLLSMVNELTKVYIEQAQANLKIEALAETFPFEIKNVNTIKEKDTAYYEIKDANNALLGVGVETFTEKGYGGKVSILLALSPECTIFDYKVLSHQETPGLGDKITNEFFKNKILAAMAFVEPTQNPGNLGLADLLIHQNLLRLYCFLSLFASLNQRNPLCTYLQIWLLAPTKTFL